jgi:hypothetical protein
VKIFLAALALALAACGAEHASVDDGIAWGTVQSVAELPRDDLEELSRTYEHLLVPEVAWQVVVRLDGGSAVTVTLSGERRHEPGDRVRVLFEDAGVLLL